MLKFLAPSHMASDKQRPDFNPENLDFDFILSFHLPASSLYLNLGGMRGQHSFCPGHIQAGKCSFL